MLHCVEKKNEREEREINGQIAGIDFNLHS